MKTVLFPRRDAARRGGFTLVEVVIALAIFVFGAVAIIRIFPPALGIIQNSGDKLTALNLNRTSLARFAKNSSAVPDAIHDVYFGPKPPATAVVGTAIRNNSLPRRNFQSVEGSALDRFTYIFGERQTVRKTFVSVQGQLQPVEVRYVLTSFPIRTIPATPTEPKTPPLAKIYQEKVVTGVVTRTDTTTIPQRSGLLDFTESNPPLTPTDLPAGSESFYYASYHYINENGLINSTEDEAIRSTTPPGITIDQAQLLQGRRLGPLFASTGAKVIDGPIRLKFRQLTFDPTTNLNNVSINNIIQNNLNNLGVIVVPNGVGFEVGNEVLIDYQINNWQQIVHSDSPSISPESDPALTTGAPASRKARELVLPIRALSDGIDGISDSAKVYGLLSYIGTSPASQPIQTLQVNSLDGANVPLTNPSNITTADLMETTANLAVNNPFFLWSVNRKGGRTAFDIKDRNAANADTQVLGSRVVYQTLDKWTNQLSVAPTSYTPFYDDSLGSNRNNINNGPNFTGESGNVNVAQPWRYYSWTPNNTTGINNQPGRIYFPPSEAGKTISLSYTVGVGAAAREINDAVVTISSRWERASQAPASTGAQNLANADANGDMWLAYAEPLLDANGNPVALTAIRSIKGISIQARTAWLDGANFAQVSTVGFRGESN